MVILVTGGAGYIGSQLIRSLPNHDHFKGATIRIIDNMLRETYASLMDLPLNTKYEVIEGNIKDDESLKTAFKDIEIVFDLAGITSVPLSYEKKELTMEVNVKWAKKVLDHALKVGVRKFVYSSSAAVYGPTEGVVTEEHECKPTGPYAESKLIAEQQCIRACIETGLDTAALRLGTVFGYAPAMRFDTVANRFTYLACIGMPLTVWIGAEEAKRPYLHVKDAVRGFLFAASDKRTKGQVYNLVGQNASLNELIETIKKYVPNVKIEKKKVEQPQLSYTLDDSKIRKLGFQTKHNLDDGIKEVVDKFRSFI